MHKHSLQVKLPIKNTKFKPKIQIDCIRNVVHTWHDNDYADRAKDQPLSEQEEKAFTLSK
jgi:hypothetical protein